MSRQPTEDRPKGNRFQVDRTAHEVQLFARVRMRMGATSEAEAVRRVMRGFAVIMDETPEGEPIKITLPNGRIVVFVL